MESLRETLRLCVQQMLTVRATPSRKAGTSGDGKRRGPRFDRVDRLIDEGYYDMGNKVIADEMIP